MELQNKLKDLIKKTSAVVNPASNNNEDDKSKESPNSTVNNSK